MRKVTVSIEETIKHHHDVIVDTELSDEEVGKAFDSYIRKNRHNYFDDLISLFKHDGIKIISTIKDVDGDPEMECTDVSEYVDLAFLDDADDDIHDGEEDDDDEEFEDED